MDDDFHVPPAVGMMALLEHACATAIPSARLPFIPSVWRYRLKTLLEMERRPALPSWLCRDGAPMPWVGFKAQQVRHGVRPRGLTKRRCAHTTPLLGTMSLDIEAG